MTPSLRRLLAAAVAFGVLVAGSPAASAHGANGQPIPDASHYLSSITAITPAVPGVSATIDPRGKWLSVTNTTPQTLTILGYAREPYLRIDPTGVAENSYSPTLVLNQSLFGDLSQLGDSSLPPDWHYTGTGHEVRWHDHRIHWMGADRPPAVRSAPSKAHLVGNWNVHMTLGATPVTLAGTLRWLPLRHTGLSPSMKQFLIIDVAAFTAIVLAGAFIIRRRSRAARAGQGPSPLTGVGFHSHQRLPSVSPTTNQPPVELHDLQARLSYREN